MPLSLLQRLDTMRTTAPNAADAEALLYNLCIFRDTFRRDAIRGLAPREMTADQCVAAFATLGRWRLVRKVSHQRLRIDEDLKQHIKPVPTVELCGQHFAYMMTHIVPHHDTHNYLYWEDIAAALLWASEHDPLRIETFPEELRYGAWFTQKLRLWVDAISDMASFFDMTSQRVFSSRDASVVQWYEATIQRRIELGHHYQQYIDWVYCGNAALIKKDLARERFCFEKAIGVMNTSAMRPDHILRYLQRLIEITIRQHDLTAVYEYVEHAYQIGKSMPYSLYALGTFMSRIPDHDAARRYFSEAYQPENRKEQQILVNSNILESWAQLERGIGHIREATRLYGLACQELSAYVAYDQAIYARNPAYRNRLYPPPEHHTERLAKLEQIRQRLEARIARHTKPR